MKNGALWFGLLVFIWGWLSAAAVNVDGDRAFIGSAVVGIICALAYAGAASDK